MSPADRRPPSRLARIRVTASVTVFPALGAQGQAVGGVLHVAARDYPAIRGLSGRADPEPGIGGVGPLRGRRGGSAKVRPADDHMKTVEREKRPGSVWIRLQGCLIHTDPLTSCATAAGKRSP